MTASLLLGRRAWRYSALTGGTTGSCAPAMIRRLQGCFARLPPREMASANLLFGGLLWEGIRRDEIPVIAMDEHAAQAVWIRREMVSFDPESRHDMSIPVAPGRLPLIGHLVQLSARPLQFLSSLRHVGELVRVDLGSAPMVMVTDARLDPDRWLPERARTVPKEAFIPFGGGARKCIGDAFGLIEATLVLATITARWDLHPTLDRPVQPVPRRAALTPGALPMRVRSRAHGASSSEATSHGP